MTEEEHLRPCPFCGHRVSIQCDEIEDTVCIACDECDFEGPYFFFGSIDPMDETPYSSINEAMEEVIEHWNTRKAA